MTAPISCRHLTNPRAVFHFPTREGGIRKCWYCAVCHPPMLWRSLKIASIVGTVLAAINHGDTLLRRDWTLTTVLKILLTYCVPFSVATYSALMNNRVRGPRAAAEAAGRL